MLRRAVGAAVIVAVTGLDAYPNALAQEPAPVGAEFQINTVTANDQTTNAASIDLESNGDFVVVWDSTGQDGSSFGVFGQRFTSLGAKVGIEFQISNYTVGGQYFPSVGLDADGDFVVAWMSQAQDGGDAGIFARRFSSSGPAQGSEFQVNLTTINRDAIPVVARDADGDFVVAWNSFNNQDGDAYGVFARRFNASGVAQGSQFQVTTYTVGFQRIGGIDLDSDGDFVIVWRSSDGQDGSLAGVFGQRFNSLGARQGPEFQVNTYVAGDQGQPVVGLDADGDFVIAWESQQGGGNGDIFAQRFDSSGAPRGGETQVNAGTTNGQFRPSIGVDQDGDFVVTWHTDQDGGEYGVVARHFKASGIPTSGDLQVNTTTANYQWLAAVRADADGDFVVAWSSQGQDGSDYGVFGQRFDAPALLDIDGNGQITALSDGLLILRFLFGFTGSTLTGGAVGPNCTRCDSATILPYLQSLT